MSCGTLGTFTSGRDISIPLSFTDTAGAPLDLTGYTIDARIFGTGLDLTKTTGAGITHGVQSGATLGTASLRIEDTDTAAIEFGTRVVCTLEVRLTAPGGDTPDLPGGRATLVFDGALV